MLDANNTELMIKTLKELVYIDRDNVTDISDVFNEVFTETGLWEKYQEYNLSYARYQEGDGWANALFHYFSFTNTDLRNYSAWVKLILLDEYGVEV